MHLEKPLLLSGCLIIYIPTAMRAAMLSGSKWKLSQCTMSGNGHTNSVGSFMHHLGPAALTDWDWELQLNAVSKCYCH